MKLNRDHGRWVGSFEEGPELLGLWPPMLFGAATCEPRLPLEGLRPRGKLVPPLGHGFYQNLMRGVSTGRG